MPRIKHFLLLTAVIFSAFAAVSSYAEVVDKILVVVNDEIITQGDIDRILYPIYQRYSLQYSGEELARRLDQTRQAVLMRLVQDKLLLSEAKRRKIEVEDDEVEAKIKEMRKRFATEEEFKTALGRENLVLSELERMHRDRIMIDKLIDMEIRGRVSISPSEVGSYYEAHKDEFKEPQKIRLRSMLIRVNESRSEKEAKKMADEFLARLREGGNFALLAQKYSEGPYAESGGDMGWVREGELMERINNAVFALKEGEVSDIIKTDLGFHIFMVEEKVESRAKGFDESKKQIEMFLLNKKIESRLLKWLEKLKQNAYIAFK